MVNTRSYKVSLKRKRASNKAKKSTKSKRVLFQGLQTGQSYAIIGKSEFLVNILMGHIVSLNIEEDWDFEASIFGKYMEISDTAEPVLDERIVFSYIERDAFPTINIDEDFIEIFYYILMGGDESEEFLAYSKKYLGKKNPDIVFYYMYAMSEVALNDDDEFSFKKAEYILNHYNYKGTHTYMEKMKSIITFVKTPSEKHLSEMLLVMNEEEDPYSSLIRIISAIANNTLPRFVHDRYSNMLEDMNFQKNLLKIAVAILQAESIEDFILLLVKGIIYS